MVQTQFRIQTVIDASPAQAGGRKVRQELKRIGNEAGRVEKGMKKAFFLAGGVFLIRDILQLADSFTNLENRIRVVSSSAEQFQANLKAVQVIAAQTRSSLQGTAELFQRLSIATASINLEQGRLYGVIRSINQALIVSGASAKEAENGMIQLAQGLASGALRGDELRSVLEQLPAVAQVIAREMGVPVGRLREMGEQGLITTGVIIDAFESQAAAIQASFDQTETTVSQAFTMMRNDLTILLASLDDFLGLSNLTVTALQSVDEAAIAVAASVTAMAAAWGIGAAAGLVGSMKRAVIATIAANAAITNSHVALAVGTGALKTHTSAWAVLTGVVAKSRAVFMTHPLLIIGALVGAATFAFMKWKDSIQEADTEMASLADNLDRVSVAEQLRASNRFRVLQDEAKELNREIKIISENLEEMQMQGRFRIQDARLSGDQQKYLAAVQEVTEAIAGQVKLLDFLKGKLAEVTIEAEGIVEPINKTISGLQEEVRLAGLSTEEAKIQRRIAKELEALEKNRVDINDEAWAIERNKVISLIREIALVGELRKAREKELQLAERRRATMESIVSEQAFNMAQLKRDNKEAFIAAKLRTEQERLGLEYSRGMVIMRQRAAGIEFEALEDARVSAEVFGQAEQKAKDFARALELAGDDQEKLRMVMEHFKNDASEYGKAIEDFLVNNGLRKVEDAIVDLVTTGRGNFKKFVNALLEDILRLILRFEILLPLINSLRDAGFLNFGDSGTTGTEVTVQNGGSWLVGNGPGSRWPGFAGGGSFMVGGNGGTDSQFVGFYASPDERVTVTRPEQSLGGNVNVTVINNAPKTEVKTQRSASGDVQIIIDQVKSQLASEISRGGGDVNRALESRYGVNPATGIQLG